MAQIDIALNYAKNGIKVFPCSQQKRPAVKGGDGFKDATADIEQVREWWTQYPDALIGSPNDQFVVIDVDVAGLCATNKLLVDTAVSALKEQGIVTSDCLEVTTKSGGTHFYFKKNENVTRHIYSLPSIDLLSSGGYVILPDQKVYKCKTSKTPWDAMSSLPVFDHDAFWSLASSMEEVTKTSKKLKKESKGEVGKTAYRKVAKKKDKETRDLTSIPTAKNGEDMLTQEEVDETNPPVKNSINYKTGEIEFEQTPDMYNGVSADKKKSEFVVKFDENNRLILDREIDTDVINALFHDHRVQTRLGRMMGLQVPNVGDTSLQRSIIPTHVDRKPSMGIRWSGDRTHIIIRDFSNHFADKYRQVDYNIVRLYATCRYKALVPRMKSPEFTIWFMRMLDEAGIINCTDLMKSYGYTYHERNLSPSEIKVAEGLLLLDALKSMYKGYCGTTTYSDKFCAAWCGVDASTGNRAKEKLVELGFAKVEGMYDCSGGRRTDGFFETKLLSVRTTKMNLKSAFQLKKEREEKEAKAKEEKEQMAEQQRMVTSIEMPVSQESYQKIMNFAIDHGFEDKVPDRKNMFINLGGCYGIHEITKPTADMTTYYMGDLRIDRVSAMVNGGGEILILAGESPSIEELAYKLQKDNEFSGKEQYTDEPLIGIVICNDFKPDEVDGDIDMLEVKLKEYLGGAVAFEEVTSRYESSENMFNFIYDGREVELE